MLSDASQWIKFESNLSLNQFSDLSLVCEFKTTLWSLQKIPVAVETSNASFVDVFCPLQHFVSYNENIELNIRSLRQQTAAAIVSTLMMNSGPLVYFLSPYSQKSGLISIEGAHLDNISVCVTETGTNEVLLFEVVSSNDSAVMCRALVDSVEEVDDLCTFLYLIPSHSDTIFEHVLMQKSRIQLEIQSA